MNKLCLIPDCQYSCLTFIVKLTIITSHFRGCRRVLSKDWKLQIWNNDRYKFKALGILVFLQRVKKDTVNRIVEY